MNKKKVALVCLLGAAMIFSASACGKKDADNAGGAVSQTADNNGNGAGGNVQATDKDGGNGGTADKNGNGNNGTAASRDDFDYTVSYDGIKKAKISAGTSVHDPSIIKADDKYYIFGSHMATAVSYDLRSFKAIGNGYKTKDPIYYGLLENKDAFAYAGGKTSLIPTDDKQWHVWAPDVIYNKDAGLYFLYFCTSSTWNASNLCYATSENIEGPYEWKGALIYSGFTEETIDGTDVLDYVDRNYAVSNYIRASKDYNFNKYPNAIDPTVFYDADGRMWMVYGSWSGGMFLLELDKTTGEVIHPAADADNRIDAYFGKRLMGGNHTSIEGPYILYDETSGYYYLFVSYGGLTREGGYQIRVFRSKTVDGDYVDMNGAYPFDTKNLLQYPYGLKLSGNYYLPSLQNGYMATGHNSAFIDDDGRKYIVNHTRFNNGTEYHEPRVHQYILNAEGWPCMLPYATSGEKASDTDYDMSQLAGRYYVINQGTTISAAIAEPFILYLEADGNVYGDGITGTWSATGGTYFMNITYNEISYSGVFCMMNDEAGTQVITFSAVGNNESVWGVKYE